MTSLRLPLADPDRSYSSGGQGENLMVYLEAIDSERMRERMGKERLVASEPPFAVTRGQRFRAGEGFVVGGRYLYVREGEIVGGLNYTRIGPRTVLSNLYVRPDCRGQGVAAALVARAKADFPRLCVDNSMTEQGARFFGYEPYPQKAGTPRARPS